MSQCLEKKTICHIHDALAQWVNNTEGGEHGYRQLKPYVQEDNSVLGMYSHEDAHKIFGVQHDRLN